MGGVHARAIRQLLYDLDKYLIDAVNKEKGISSANGLLKLKNHIRVFHQMLNGSDINIVHLVKKENPEIDVLAFKILKLASEGQFEYLSKIIDALGLSIQKKGIIEYFKIIMDSHTNLIEIGKLIGVEKENIEILKALFKFVIVSSKFFIYAKPK